MTTQRNPPTGALLRAHNAKMHRITDPPTRPHMPVVRLNTMPRPYFLLADGLPGVIVRFQQDTHLMPVQIDVPSRLWLFYLWLLIREAIRGRLYYHGVKIKRNGSLHRDRVTAYAAWERKARKDDV
jgi:hypothetical protein